jgi:5'-3' exonuclease
MSTPTVLAVDGTPLPPSAPTVLAVDGNSLLHRSFHAQASSMYRTPDGEQGWAVRGLLSQLSAAVDRVCADVVVVGFDDRGNSSRKRRWPTYKAQRPPKPESLERQLDLAVQVLRDLGVVVVVPEGLEADDVLASVAAQAPALGARTVVATSDRDSFSLIDEHTRMLRILNGGVDASPLLDPARLAMVTGVRPEQYVDLAALRGDASDNLPGVHGFGPKTAVKLLQALDTAEAAFDDAENGGERCAAAIGKARTRSLQAPEARPRWQLNREVMAMVTTAELGLDLHGKGRLPLDEDAVRATYSRFECHVPAAIRALTLREPTRTVTEPQADPWRDPRWKAAPQPRPGPLPKLIPAPSGPAYVQEALF